MTQPPDTRMIDKKPRKIKLGKWQVKSLEMIMKHQACCTHSLLAIIIGRAKRWDRKYKRSLKNAIDAHNSRRAINSPIPPNFLILEKSASSLLQDDEYCGFTLKNISII